MLKDSHYVHPLASNRPRAIHHYGSHIHLIDHPYCSSLLANFCEAKTSTAQLFQILRTCMSVLMMETISHSFKRTRRLVRSRMADIHPQGRFEMMDFDPKVKVVFVDLMRAGILPSQIAYETALGVLPETHLRQDHILLNRVTNKNGEVTGTQISGHKIGGSVKNAYVVVADPMGATGSTIKAAVNLYRSREKARPIKFIALHLIVTPEYLRAVKPLASDLEVFAFRLDRGLSSKRALASTPGKYWNEEKGLNGHDYIVPGAGGIGELLNNSWV